MDFKQYKQKKKRKVDPNLPRPNLFSHEKKIREVTTKSTEHEFTIDALRRDLSAAKRRLHYLETQVSTLVSAIKTLSERTRPPRNR